MANTQSISNALGINFSANTDSTDPNTIFVQDKKTSKAENDYEFARGNLYSIIENGQRALDDMIEFAKQAQHPRAYEVVGGLINNLVDANQKLLNLSKQVKEITDNAQQKEGGDTINNNLFVGSTAELHKLLKGDNG